LRFIAAIRSLSYRGIIRNLKGHFEPFYKSQHRVSPEITLMYGLVLILTWKKTESF